MMQDTFLPYFAAQGHDTYAISFRQQGKSSQQAETKVAGSLASHAADVQHFIESLPEPPVLIAHSFGGLIAQRYSAVSHAYVVLRIPQATPFANTLYTKDGLFHVPNPPLYAATGYIDCLFCDTHIGIKAMLFLANMKLVCRHCGIFLTQQSSGVHFIYTILDVAGTSHQSHHLV